MASSDDDPSRDHSVVNVVSTKSMSKEHARELMEVVKRFCTENGYRPATMILHHEVKDCSRWKRARVQMCFGCKYISSYNRDNEMAHSDAACPYHGGRTSQRGRKSQRRPSIAAAAPSHGRPSMVDNSNIDAPAWDPIPIAAAEPYRRQSPGLGNSDIGTAARHPGQIGNPLLQRVQPSNIAGPGVDLSSIGRIPVQHEPRPSVPFYGVPARVAGSQGRPYGRGGGMVFAEIIGSNLTGSVGLDNGQGGHGVARQHSYLQQPVSWTAGPTIFSSEPNHVSAGRPASIQGQTPFPQAQLRVPATYGGITSDPSDRGMDRNFLHVGLGSVQAANSVPGSVQTSTSVCGRWASDGEGRRAGQGAAGLAGPTSSHGAWPASNTLHAHIIEASPAGSSQWMDVAPVPGQYQAANQPMLHTPVRDEVLSLATDPGTSSLLDPESLSMLETFEQPLFDDDHFGALQPSNDNMISRAEPIPPSLEGSHTQQAVPGSGGDGMTAEGFPPADLDPFAEIGSQFGSQDPDLWCRLTQATVPSSHGSMAC